MFKKLVLKNGLRLVLVPKRESLATTVLVLVEAGSEYETRETSGLSHFLEHMCFKGTVKRPKMIDIAREFDYMGADYNAFTGKEYTGYYAKAESRHINEVVDIISDIYLNSVFPETEMEKERGVILEEINMYEDLPQKKVREVLEEVFYGDTPEGWSVGGDKEVIKKLERRDFLYYKNKHYVAQKTVVVVAGNFTEEKIVLEIEKRFGGLEQGGTETRDEVKVKQREPAVKGIDKTIDQMHLALGFKAFPIKDERRYALSILTTIIGQGMSSRLFQILREEMGVAYYVSAGSQLMTRHGEMIVTAGVGREKTGEVVQRIVRELRLLKEDGVNEREIELAKEKRVGSLVLGLETSDDLAEFYGAQEIIRENILTPQELTKKWREIRREEVKSLSNELFRPDNVSLALVGRGAVGLEEELKEMLNKI